jgi:uncharacterized protein YndB with AHSA1/START domain
MKEIYHCFDIQSAQDKVFKTIIEKDGLAGWWTKSLDHSGEVGTVSTFRFESGAFNSMKIIKIEPDFIEWLCLDGHEQWIGTHITFELHNNDTGTEVRFSHFGFREQTPYVGSCSFMWAAYLSSLQQFCETGHGNPNPGIK